MALPKFTINLIESKLSTYCEQRIPPHAKQQVKLSFKIRGNSVTLFEHRKTFRQDGKWVDIPIAQFRYNPDHSMWTLYCTDRNSKWHEFTPFPPSKNFDDLLTEVNEDSTHIFWG